jgi:hypothetical protein
MTLIHSAGELNHLPALFTCHLGDAACNFFKGGLILGKPEAGARSTMQLLLIERSRAPVSLIRACPWACEVNSNSYWSDQAGQPQGQDQPGQLAFYKQELSIT